MTLYLENTKDDTHTKLELINEFRKVLWSYFKLPDDTVMFVFSLLLVIQLFLYWCFSQLLGVGEF